MNAVITVEDFGGADEVKKFYDEWNKEFKEELIECWNGDSDEWYEEDLEEYIDDAIYRSVDDSEEFLPIAVLEKTDKDWEISDEVKKIAKESCNECLNKKSC